MDATYRRYLRHTPSHHHAKRVKKDWLGRSNSRYNPQPEQLDSTSISTSTTEVKPNVEDSLTILQDSDEPIKIEMIQGCSTTNTDDSDLDEVILHPGDGSIPGDDSSTNSCCNDD